MWLPSSRFALACHLHGTLPRLLEHVLFRYIVFSAQAYRPECI